MTPLIGASPHLIASLLFGSHGRSGFPSPMLPTSLGEPDLSPPIQSCWPSQSRMQANVNTPAMGIENLSDESLLRLYENSRRSLNPPPRLHRTRRIRSPLLSRSPT